jgi:hypothetical protein
MCQILLQLKRDIVVAELVDIRDGNVLFGSTITVEGQELNATSVELERSARRTILAAPDARATCGGVGGHAPFYKDQTPFFQELAAPAQPGFE